MYKAKKKSIKILEENTGSNLFDIGHSNFFQGMSPKARETKAKMNVGTSSRYKKKLVHGKGNSQQN